MNHGSCVELSRLSDEASTTGLLTCKSAMHSSRSASRSEAMTSKTLHGIPVEACHNVGIVRRLSVEGIMPSWGLSQGRERNDAQVKETLEDKG